MSGRTPVHLVTGVDPAAMAGATIALQWALPDAVVVQHRVEPERDELVRIVSDVTGMLEREVIDLEHGCVSCAIREDVVPTLARLGELGRWGAIVAHLPVGAEPSQVCRVAAFEPSRLADVRIASTIAAVDGAGLLDDLMGEDLLGDREAPLLGADERAVAEVLAPIVEYADVVAVHGDLPDAARDLIDVLARPGAQVVHDWEGLDVGRLALGVHDHDRTEAWVADVRRDLVRLPSRPRVWTLDLRSDRPLHPARLLEQIETLGSHPVRARGCFWVPARPSDVLGWDGAGGQLSIGAVGAWGLRGPLTHIVVTGLDEQAELREVLRGAFEACLLSDAEMQSQDPVWQTGSDGLEEWLGPVRRVA